MQNQNLKRIRNYSSGKAKIVYVSLNNICKPTAMANRTITITNALYHYGYEVEIISLALFDPGLEVPRDLNSAISIKYYASKNQFKPFAYTRALILCFWDLIHRRNDALYFYGYNGLIELLFLLIIFCKSNPVVVREITEYPGYNTDIGKLSKWIFRQILEKSQIILVINNALADYINTLTDKPSVIVANITVDMTRFKDLAREYKNIITYVGDMQPGKDGVHNLLRAFALFQKSTSEEYKLRIIGEISDKRRLSSFKSVCRQELIEESVKFIGRANREEIPGMLCESKMLVLCRPQNRQAIGGFPTKLGEYLASGVPVVVTDVGEISIFIKDGINGFLAESNDPQIFSLKMKEVVENYEHAIEIGLEGRKLAGSEFSAEKQVEKFAPFIDSLLGNTSKKAHQDEE